MVHIWYIHITYGTLELLLTIYIYICVYKYIDIYIYITYIYIYILDNMYVDKYIDI